jgi:hypothetical protein
MQFNAFQITNILEDCSKYIFAQYLGDKTVK